MLCCLLLLRQTRLARQGFALSSGRMLHLEHADCGQGHLHGCLLQQVAVQGCEAKPAAGSVGKQGAEVPASACCQSASCQVGMRCCWLSAPATGECGGRSHSIVCFFNQRPRWPHVQKTATALGQPPGPALPPMQCARLAFLAPFMGTI